jgi:hypothetical protein
LPDETPERSSGEGRIEKYTINTQLGGRDKRLRIMDFISTLLTVFDRQILTVKMSQSISPIDLVLINQQSVGNRSLNLMDTVNAKKRWTTIYWCQQIL